MRIILITQLVAVVALTNAWGTAHAQELTCDYYREQLAKCETFRTQDGCTSDGVAKKVREKCKETYELCVSARRRELEQCKSERAKPKASGGSGANVDPAWSNLTKAILERRRKDADEERARRQRELEEEAAQREREESARERAASFLRDAFRDAATMSTASWWEADPLTAALFPDRQALLPKLLEDAWEQERLASIEKEVKRKAGWSTWGWVASSSAVTIWTRYFLEAVPPQDDKAEWRLGVTRVETFAVNHRPVPIDVEFGAALSGWHGCDWKIASTKDEIEPMKASPLRRLRVDTCGPLRWNQEPHVSAPGFAWSEHR